MRLKDRIKFIKENTGFGELVKEAWKTGKNTDYKVMGNVEVDMTILDNAWKNVDSFAERMNSFAEETTKVTGKKRKSNKETEKNGYNIKVSKHSQEPKSKNDDNDRERAG